MILSAVQAAGFYLVPYLTGRLVRANWLEAWALGCLMWFGLVLAAGRLAAGSATTLSHLVAASAVVVALLWAARLRRWRLLRPPRYARGHIVVVLAVAAFAAGAYAGLWSRQQPYPLEVNWDAFEHTTAANAIAAGRVAFLPSAVSDTFTFNGYSTLFHTLLALTKLLFAGNVLGAFWWLNACHYGLTVIACACLASAVCRSRLAGAGGAVFGVCAFESWVAYEPLFLIPQTLTALVAAFAVFDTLTRPSASLASRVPVLAVMVLTNFAVGSVAALIVLAFAVHKRSGFERLLGSRSLMAASAASLALGLGLHGLGSWQLTGREEALHYLLPLSSKLDLLAQWYGLLFLGLAALGAGFVAKSGSPGERLAASVALAVVGLGLAPFSYVLKFFTLGHFFLAVLVAAGLAGLAGRFSRPARSLAVMWLAAVGLLLFARNSSSYLEPLAFLGAESNISRGEIQAADWLAGHAPPDALIVSDPATQAVLEAASGVNTQGGAYMSLTTRRALEAAAGQSRRAAIAGLLAGIHDELPGVRERRPATLFVASGRYFEWQRLTVVQRESFYDNIWQPVLLTKADDAYIDWLAGGASFKLVFRNDELAVLEVHQ